MTVLKNCSGESGPEEEKKEIRMKGKNKNEH
jgi:hypothetical protein